MALTSIPLAMIRCKTSELAGLKEVKVRVIPSNGGSLSGLRTGDEYMEKKLR
jgi:hypothetical protein